MAASKIDAKFCFYNPQDGTIATSTDPVDLKNCMNDKRLIAVEGAIVLTSREYAELKHRPNPEEPPKEEVESEKPKSKRGRPKKV